MDKQVVILTVLQHQATRRTCWSTSQAGQPTRASCKPAGRSNSNTALHAVHVCLTKLGAGAAGAGAGAVGAGAGAAGASAAGAGAGVVAGEGVEICCWAAACGVVVGSKPSKKASSSIFDGCKDGLGAVDCPTDIGADGI